MKTVNESTFRKMDNSGIKIVSIADISNRGQKGGRMKRRVNGNKYISFDFIEQCRTYSVAQLRLRLESETGERLRAVKKALRERGAIK